MLVRIIPLKCIPYFHEPLALGADEYVYGLGERFIAFVKNVHVVNIWNKDGETSSYPREEARE